MCAARLSQISIFCPFLPDVPCRMMCAVGVETLSQGEFHSLAVYLLVSSGGMLVFELSFFTDVLLMWCLPCPPKWKVFTLWKKMAKLGGFQKFLYYTLMSVVCFLHPVLLWHAVIPGTMLLVTGFAYFILSKKQKPPSAKEPTSASGCYEDASMATTFVGDSGEAEQTYSFLRVVAGNRATGLSHFPAMGDQQERTQATLEDRRTVDASDVPPRKRDKRHVHFKDKAPYSPEDETEMQEYQDVDQEETTSDKVPMIRP
ncbi:hypothetical protein SKAU_G00179200 [Synaphobranchus kaupii]|uniref:Transmembrane protein 72 n=1 Tax=Synaphobranchus kaupii TaxID=118154 RepID=A0A9Q1J1I1_SYNKA|nr:hypothetical protein SKAU_G00179200 [Synaphobranchus kaupii]